MDFFSLLSVIATLFLLLAAGFVCRKVGVINDTASKNLSKLIIWLGQPMLIVGSLTAVEFTMENLRQGALIAGLGMLSHLFMALVAALACRPIRSLDEEKITEFACIFSNCGFIGFPILQAIFGDIGLFWGAFYVISFHLFLWTWGIAILARKREDIKLTVKKIFINFGTIPCAIGVALYLMQAIPGVVIPDFMQSFIDYLGSLCTPVSMLITGALLATRTPKQIFGSGRIYYLCLFKLIVMPLLVLFGARLCRLSYEMCMLLTVMAAMPSASTVSMLAELHGISPGYASQAVGTTTLLSTATLPLILYVAELLF